MMLSSRQNIFLLVGLIAVASCQPTGRRVDGMPYFHWLGGNDDLIRCAGNVAVATIGPSTAHYLDDVVIRVHEEDSWIFEGQHVSGLCYGDYLIVDRSMLSLVHELLESLSPRWHQNTAPYCSSDLCEYFLKLDFNYMTKIEKECLP